MVNGVAVDTGTAKLALALVRKSVAGAMPVAWRKARSKSLSLCSEGCEASAEEEGLAEVGANRGVERFGSTSVAPLSADEEEEEEREVDAGAVW